MPSSGMNVLDWSMKVWRYLRATTPRVGPGLQMTESPSGTIISLAPKKTTAGTAQLPLTVIQGSEPDKIQVTPGYANTAMPTISTVALDAATPPEITITAASTHVWLKYVGSFDVNGVQTSGTATIETNTSITPPAGTTITPTSFTTYRRLAWIEKTGSGADTVLTITQIHGGGNLGVESYGNVNLWWLA